MARKGQDQQGRDQDDIAFAPYTTVQKKVLGSPRLQVAYASAISQDATYTAQEQITELLRQRHKLTANEPNDFTVRNMTDIAEAANETNNTMTILLACIASVSLLVGGIGIMNIMLVSVTERTREIGIRMAIGARSSAVRSQFLIESIVLSLTGGFIGIVLGIAVSFAIPSTVGLANLDFNPGDCRLSNFLSGSGNLLRLLSRAQSRRARSHRSAALRIKLKDIRRFRRFHRFRVSAYRRFVLTSRLLICEICGYFFLWNSNCFKFSPDMTKSQKKPAGKRALVAQ